MDDDGRKPESKTPLPRTSWRKKHLKESSWCGMPYFAVPSTAICRGWDEKSGGEIVPQGACYAQIRDVGTRAHSGSPGGLCGQESEGRICHSDGDLGT